MNRNRKMKIHNTLTRSIDKISPLEEETIKLYTCGLTVYSQPHIGNWVSYIYWDLLKSTLEIAGFKVIHSQNYTDVGHLVSDDDKGEDKLEKGARIEGITAWEIAEKYIKIAEKEAYDTLRLTRPTYLARATDYIEQQIDFVKSLENKGLTYVIENEGVYFDTSKIEDYGKLARLDIDGLQAGARVDIVGKKNITDFALWKFSPQDKKRDMEWDSPWGKGFPGWHLECSVIARETLGDQIDIHTGGIDHIPVHHTNEIAQTESLTGKQFSKYWVHNNHLKVDGQKMSKSIGNIYTLQDIEKNNFSVEAFKLLILSKHYRTEGNFTWENLEASSNRLSGYYRMIDYAAQHQFNETSDNNKEYFNDLKNKYLQALFNDLDTPMALAHLSEAEKSVISSESTFRDSSALEAFYELIRVAEQTLRLGLTRRQSISSAQQKLIDERNVAKQKKDWSKADKLRQMLSEQNIQISDTQSRTLWFRK